MYFSFVHRIKGLENHILKLQKELKHLETEKEELENEFDPWRCLVRMVFVWFQSGDLFDLFVQEKSSLARTRVGRNSFNNLKIVNCGVCYCYCYIWRLRFYRVRVVPSAGSFESNLRCCTPPPLALAIFFSSNDPGRSRQKLISRKVFFFFLTRKEADKLELWWFIDDGLCPQVLSFFWKHLLWQSFDG